MKDGVCPKCKAAEVHIVTQTAVEVSIAITWSKTAGLNYYVCTNCGYVELFVQEEGHLPHIAEKYPKVF